MQKPLTDAEKAVDAIIKESIKPYANRAEVLVDYAQDDGASWLIIPKNPHVTHLRIYFVGPNDLRDQRQQPLHPERGTCKKCWRLQMPSR